MQRARQRLCNGRPPGVDDLRAHTQQAWARVLLAIWFGHAHHARMHHASILSMHLPHLWHLRIAPGHRRRFDLLAHEVLERDRERHFAFSRVDLDDRLLQVRASRWEAPMPQMTVREMVQRLQVPFEAAACAGSVARCATGRRRTFLSAPTTVHSFPLYFSFDRPCPARACRPWTSNRGKQMADAQASAPARAASCQQAEHPERARTYRQRAEPCSTPSRCRCLS